MGIPIQIRLNIKSTMYKATIALIFAALIASAAAYPNGSGTCRADADTISASAMSGPTNASPGGFTFTTSDANPNGGDSITLTVDNGPDGDIKGFLVYCVDPDTQINGMDKRSGVMTACDEMGDYSSTITHTQSNDKTLPITFDYMVATWGGATTIECRAAVLDNNQADWYIMDPVTLTIQGNVDGTPPPTTTTTTAAPIGDSASALALGFTALLASLVVFFM